MLRSALVPTIGWLRSAVVGGVALQGTSTRPSSPAPFSPFASAGIPRRVLGGRVEVTAVAGGVVRVVGGGPVGRRAAPPDAGAVTPVMGGGGIGWAGVAAIGAAPGIRLRDCTPGSSDWGTVTISGPLPAASTQGPVHSMPLVNRLPLTMTRTWYLYRGTKSSCPV